jgi:L-arabinose isomerase
MDTANAVVRPARPFEVIMDDWQAPAFAVAVGRWAHAAAAGTRRRRLNVAVFGYPMNAAGDSDPSASAGSATRRRSSSSTVPVR